MHQIQRILFLKQDPTSKVNIQVDARTEVGNLLFNMSPETPSASVIRIRSIDNLIIDKIYIKDMKKFWYLSSFVKIYIRQKYKLKKSRLVCI